MSEAGDDNCVKVVDQIGTSPPGITLKAQNSRPPAPTRRAPRRIAKRRIDRAARGNTGGPFYATLLYAFAYAFAGIQRKARCLVRSPRRRAALGEALEPMPGEQIWSRVPRVLAARTRQTILHSPDKASRSA